MKIESILQYFWPALSDNWSWNPIVCLFESGGFTEVLLYSELRLELQTHTEHDI